MFRPTKIIDLKTPLSNKMSTEEANQNIQVFVRCRPLNSHEKKGLIEIIPEKRAIRTIQQNKVYSFDSVFDAKAKQLDVYRSVVEPLVEQVIEGYNCTVFAYGQTGTGKTYTMVGNRSDSEISWEDDPLSGIIPRSIDQLLDDLQNQNTEYTIRVSFLELYNEEAYDLLSPLSDTTKLRIYNDTERKGSVIISGLVEMIVKTKEEIFEILEKGSLKRQTAPTLMNACSSRSHSIFSITVHIKEITFDGEEVVKMGKLNLVDLAGSENIGRSGAVEERAREASNINKSLLTLGRVITSLVEKSSHIPYRDSKLTRLLQDSLGGKTKTSIIATISPCSDDLEDTISTLDYAQRAKKITNKPEINLKMSKKTLINEYLSEIDRLRRDLEASRDRKGIYVDAKNYAIMEATIKSQEQDLELKEAKIESMKLELEKYTLLLSEANENFNNKCQELTNTLEKLEELSNVLESTKEFLKKTQQEVEEYKILVDAHKNSEKRLLKKAELVVNVTDKCVDDNRKLFNKVDSYVSLENHNVNCFQQFKDVYYEQIGKITNWNNLMCSTFSEGYNSIVNLIENNKREIQNKNMELETNLNGLENKVDHFAQLFLKSMNRNKEDVTKMNCDLQTVLDNFKKTMRDEFSSFSLAMKENVNNSVRILTELYDKSIKNRTTQEESIMSQISQINEFSTNIIQMVQLIDEDFRKISSQRCQENEELSKEVFELKNIIENMNIDKKIKEIFESLNNITMEYQEKIATISNTVQNCKTRMEGLSKNDAESQDSLSFKCKELINFVRKDEKEIYSILSNLDEQSSENCQSIIEKYDQIKRLQEKLNYDYTGFKNKCETNMIDDVFVKMDEKIESFNDSLINRSAYNVKLVKNFKTESSDINNSNRYIVNDLSSTIFESLNQTLDRYKCSEESCRALKTSQDIEFNEFKKMVKNLEKSYKKYQSSGVTPKRCSYTYPKCFTPTSPHERIIARFRNENVQKLDPADVREQLDFSENSDNYDENIDMLDDTIIASCKNKKMDHQFQTMSDRTFCVKLLKEKNN